MPLFDADYLISIFLVFVRIGAVMVTAPFFGHLSVPVRVKIPLSLLMAYGMVGFVNGPPPDMVSHPFGLIVATGIEALTGVMLGYAAQFIFWAVSHAAEVIGFQMGLALATAYNPIDGTHSNPIGRVLSMTLLLVFILLDGHHHIVRALVTSFEVVPLAGARLAEGGPLMLEWTGEFFMTALRLASPFMITIFLVDVTLGVFARVAPQADLFSIGIPLKLMMGLTITLFFMQNLLPIVPDMVQQLLTDLMTLIRRLSPL